MSNENLMKPLGFRIERRPWPEESGMAASPPRAVKIRDDGRMGDCVGDEAALWDEIEFLREENAALQRQLEKKGAKK